MTLLRLIARQVGAIIKARLRQVAVRAVWLAVAVVALLFTLLFASGAGYFYLATLIAPWYAALCVAGGWLVLMALALMVATRRSQPAAVEEFAGEATQLTLAEARARGEELARRVEPEHLVVLGLVAGLAAGRKVGRRED